MFKIQNKKTLILSSIFCLGLLPFIIAAESSKEQNKETFQNLKLGPNIDFLWQKSVHQILRDPLWKGRDAYDAGHYKVYLEPDTARDRHPLIKGKAQFEDGLLELISN